MPSVARFLPEGIAAVLLKQNRHAELRRSPSWLGRRPGGRPRVFGPSAGHATRRETGMKGRAG